MKLVYEELQLITHIKYSKCKKPLYVSFDYKRNLGDHISELFKYATSKINAPVRAAPYSNISKRCNLINAFFTSQLNYY